MRRLVPMLVLLSLVVATFAECGGDGGGNTKAFCNGVKEIRKLGRDPGSAEPGDPKLLQATIDGLRNLERSAPSDLRGDIATIRETLETIASIGEGKRVDPKKIDQLSANAEKIRHAGENIDREVKRCGIGDG